MDGGVLISVVLIFLLLTIVGGVMAFDVKGIGSAFRKQAVHSILKGEGKAEDYDFDITKVVGWIFFVVGAAGLILWLASTVKNLIF